MGNQLASTLEQLITPLQQLFTTFITFYFQIYLIKLLFGLVESLVSGLKIPAS